MKTVYNLEIFLRIIGGIENEVTMTIRTETAVWKSIRVGERGDSPNLGENHKMLPVMN